MLPSGIELVDGSELPTGIELAFCPTGPGGGVDNSCGKGEGGGLSDIKIAQIKDEIKTLTVKRDTVIKLIKEAKASGGSFSALKKQRADLNKQIADKQNEISGSLKATMKATAPPSAGGPKLSESKDFEQLMMDGTETLGFKGPTTAAVHAFASAVEKGGGTTTLNAYGVKVQAPTESDDIEPGDFWQGVADAGDKHGIQLSKLAATADSVPTPQKIGDVKVSMTAPPPGSFTDNEGKVLSEAGIKQFQSEAAATKFGTEHYGKWSHNLTQQEEDAISAYTGSGYHEINGQLRSSVLNEKIQKRVDAIDAAMEKAPALPHDMLVHRGVGTQSQIFHQMKPGDTFIERGYVSTAVKKGGSFSGGVKLNIKVPAGVPGVGAYVSHKQGLGIKHETEFLMRRDTTFKVKAVREVGATKIIDLEVVARVKGMNLSMPLFEDPDLPAGIELAFCPTREDQEVVHG